MIDMNSEELIPLFKSDGEFKPGKKVAKQTLHRWATCGVKGGIRLETMKICGTRYTSRQAIERFIQAQNSPAESAPVVSPAQRRRQCLAAKQELAKMGIQ